MKKSLFFAVAATVLSGCASDELVDVSVPNTGTSHSDIRFTISQKNTTRGYSDLNKTGHYNFGVFAYKNTDKVNSVMPNYLVGYCDGENGYEQNIGSTWGDQAGVEDGKSWWAYEGLGSAEYNGTYAGGALTADYTSNNENQYLKYWDNAADYTCFYAYAPYINSGVKLTATYVDGTAQSATGADTYVLTIPNGTLTDGYDDPSLAEYMYASTKVEKANYGHDVALQFHRLNAKVNIKFWEDVPGWKVRILDLSSSAEGVQAAASVHDGASGQYGYKAGKYYTSNGIKVQFGYANNPVTDPKEMQYKGVTANNTTTLKFKSPTVAEIGENRYEASASATTYYAIPKGQGNVLEDGSDFNTTGVAEDADLVKTGFTFHVSYELTAQDTGEKIVVKNATVHVPYDYCNWKSNTHYTYIFKITRDSNGSTDENPTIDPTDPEVPTVQSLYPIVFDNCTVLDWEENESEWVITEGTTPQAYHNITLTEGGVGMYSFKSNVEHVLDVAIADADKYLTHSVDYDKVTVEGPDAADENTWYASGTKQITVPAGAAAGLYTVTYTCPAPAAAHVTHPATFTQTFYVGNDYAVALNLYKVATKALAGTKLDITLTKDGAAAPAPTADQLYIDYPNHVTPNDKVVVDIANGKVTIAQDADPGVYKIVYKIKEGDKQVKVDEKTFEVINWQHSLSKKVVFLDNGGSLEVTKSGVDDAITLDADVASAGKITISGTTINVANDCPEGTYNVYYTVNRTDATSIATYLKSFEVKNTYKVTLSATSIDYNKDWNGASDTYGSEFITVTPWVNGVAKTSGTSTLAVKQGATDKTSLFTLTDNGNGTYKLQVKPQTAVPGNYTVEFTENGVVSTVDFVVTK